MVQVARSADGNDCAITVRPNSALPHRGDGPCLFLGSVAAGTLSGLFWQLGAWPVALCLLAAISALAGAFLVTRLRAGQYQRLVFHDRLLRIEQHGRGHDEAQEVNATWVRLVRPDPATADDGFWLRVHGRGLRLGSFLSRREQRHLARLVAGELARLEH
jgi:uncharacterized membrane protein